MAQISAFGSPNVLAESFAPRPFFEPLLRIVKTVREPSPGTCPSRLLAADHRPKDAGGGAPLFVSQETCCRFAIPVRDRSPRTQPRLSPATDHHPTPCESSRGLRATFLVALRVSTTSGACWTMKS